MVTIGPQNDPVKPKKEQKPLTREEAIAKTVKKAQADLAKELGYEMPNQYHTNKPGETVFEAQKKEKKPPNPGVEAGNAHTLNHAMNHLMATKYGKK